MRYSRAYYLIPATALSRIGTVAYTIVVTWYISQNAGQQMVGVMNALSGAGIFLASILGFVVIDRFKKKSLLIFYDIFNSLCCLCALILLSSARGEFIVYILIILSALMSLAATAYSPTSRAIIPEILGHREFEKYNSTYSMVGELSRAVSPLVGTMILMQNFANALELSIIVNLVSFILSLVLTFMVPAGSVATRRSKGSEVFQKTHILHDLRLGLVYIASSAYFRRELFFAALLNMWGASTLFLLLGRIAYMGLGQEVYGLGMFMGTMGAVAASFILNRIPALRRWAHPHILLSVIGGTYMLALIPGIVSVIAAQSIVSGIIVIYTIGLFSDLQKKSDAEHIGKVMSVFSLAAALFTSLGNLLFSHLSARVYTGAYAFVCAASLALTVAVLWAIRHLLTRASK
ncbi:MFS transporter [Rothia dentocariosa]|uniref:MFS transporter n=1 Tax=Rothia dentocariosa TaxID=2047 RepID=UPI00214CC660|nr:MFS transporter [Rothia dentocariosa]